METTDKQFKILLIETFKEFDNFCKKHNIKYYACGGTLIGAVRHKGLIPWDDDIDVWMLREDYEKFISLRGQVDGHYDIIDSRDENYWLLSLAKFADTNTTLWEMEEYPCVTGIYIDVFPLFECDSKNALIQKKEYDRLTAKLKRSMRVYSYKKIISIIKEGKVRELCKIIQDIFYYNPLHNHLKNKYDVFFDKIRNEEGDVYVSYEGDYKEREIFQKDLFNSVVRLPYENLDIDAPQEYHKILTQIYDNYMQLPPEEKRKSHHPHYFVDLTKRWTIEEIKNYKRKHNS